jgi:hypothetical protein
VKKKKKDQRWAKYEINRSKSRTLDEMKQQTRDAFAADPLDF